MEEGINFEKERPEISAWGGQDGLGWARACAQAKGKKPIKGEMEDVREYWNTRGKSDTGIGIEGNKENFNNEEIEEYH